MSRWMERIREEDERNRRESERIRQESERISLAKLAAEQTSNEALTQYARVFLIRSGAREMLEEIQADPEIWSGAGYNIVYEDGKAGQSRVRLIYEYETVLSRMVSRSTTLDWTGGDRGGSSTNSWTEPGPRKIDKTQTDIRVTVNWDGNQGKISVGNGIHYWYVLNGRHDQFLDRPFKEVADLETKKKTVCLERKNFSWSEGVGGGSKDFYSTTKGAEMRPFIEEHLMEAIRYRVREGYLPKDLKADSDELIRFYKADSDELIRFYKADELAWKTPKKRSWWDRFLNG